MTEHPKHDLTSESHRATCSECAATWAELEAISAEARALPTLTPSHDLWAGIATRIGGAPAGAATDASQAAHTTNTPARAKAARRWVDAPAVRFAAAAAILITATATVTWKVATASRTTPPTVVEGATPQPLQRPVVVELIGADEPDRLPRMRAAAAASGSDFETMDLEIRTLQELLTRRRSQLDSTTVAILERNMQLIDTAIAESRAAFLRDPASQFLAAQLARSYSTKLTLLRSTATMPAGT